MEAKIIIDPFTRALKPRFPTRVFLALFLPIAILVMVLGISLSSQRTNAHIEKILSNDSARISLIGGFLGAEILNSLQHLRSISNEAAAMPALDSGSKEHMRLLESAFLSLASRNPQYQQVRWIDNSGTEVVRVSSNQGEAYVVAPEQLQDKSSRYYFNAANKLLPGELYISRVDLNTEHGQVEIPIKPVLRIATPVVDSNQKRRGIFIININMKHLFDLVQTRMGTDIGTEYLLVNQQGVVLNGEAFEAVSTDGELTEFILPDPKVRENVLANDSGMLELPDGLWAWKRLSPVATFNNLMRAFPSHMVSFDQLIIDDFSVTLVSRRPLGVLLDVRTESRLLVIIGILFTLSIYAVSLYFYLTGHIRTRVAEIQSAQAMAHAASMKRLKELEERFHRLVDASSIGQIVVDSNGRIELSNPAAEHMLGYESGELEGVLVEALLPTGKQEQHAQYRKQFMEMPEARMMGTGRELEAVRKDGTKIPVEVGLTPYTDQGRTLVLTSIIDLSHRQYN